MIRNLLVPGYRLEDLEATINPSLVQTGEEISPSPSLDKLHNSRLDVRIQIRVGHKPRSVYRNTGPLTDLTMQG